MRVLCLHPETSSAYQFSQELQKLEERLWTKHGIELVFVDGPLLDVQVGTAIGEEGGGINAIDSSGGSNGEEECVSRRWYVEEESRRAITHQSTTNNSPPPQTSQIQYSGLDASILHLSQIWTRGGANISNNLGECLPFQGVLGVGQGANVASLLPLLNYQNEDEEEVNGDCEKENSATGGLAQHTKPSMFQGLKFVVSIDGKDILSRRDVDNVNGSEEDENEEVYVGPDGVQSLHVINTESDTSQSSQQLAKQYGMNATIHHYKQQQQPSSTKSTATNITPSLSNIIGKYLVSQKNKLHSNPKSRELISLQNQLSNVEQLATLAISQEIQKNPPKALMAVIGPTAMMSNNDTTADDEGDNDDAQDKEVEAEATETQHKQKKENVKVVDKAVGAWHGARRRGFGEEGGGAPCPGEFLLREEERKAAPSSLVNSKDPNARLV